jgi:RNA polymerase sigma-70 factor (ECF subfamily)
VLQRLGPAERVVFVLHDIFGVPFDSVAETLGRPTATCRQLARRARQKIQDSPLGAAVDVGTAEHRQVTENFIAACANGDLDGLLAVLAPSAWGDFDAGPGGKPLGVIHGALRVARHHPGEPPGSRPARPPGFAGRELSGVLVFTMTGDRIQAVHVIGDPRKLGAIGSQLA